MKKLISIILITGLVTISVCACGKSPETTVEPESVDQVETVQDTGSDDTAAAVTSEASEIENSTETGQTDENTDGTTGDEQDSNPEASVTLPPYEYPGPELFYYVLYQYLIDEYSPYYEKSDVTIPCPYILAIDDSDKSNIKVWGDFWIFNYDLNGTVLENRSGGSYPGCIHMNMVDDSRGYEVTEMELVGDGSDFEPTARKIFGDHYQELIDSSADEKGRRETRAQIIANYAAANDLDITAYQDYGWDPVTLPEENIDSFYSILD